jgi:Glyoxalase/Bleomycin resistance protein/Dioxygenase superfamily
MRTPGGRSPQNIIADLKSPAEPTTILGSAMTSQVHLAYITNDTDGSIRHFEALGIGPWNSCDIQRQPISGPSAGSAIRASFARMAGRMFEIVEPMSDAPPIFSRPGGPSLAITFHHVGAFMDVEPDVVVAAAKSAGMEFHRSQGARGEIVFVDTRPTLGHWLEVLCFAQAERGAAGSGGA